MRVNRNGKKQWASASKHNRRPLAFIPKFVFCEKHHSRTNTAIFLIPRIQLYHWGEDEIISIFFNLPRHRSTNTAIHFCLGLSCCQGCNVYSETVFQEPKKIKRIKSYKMTALKVNTTLVIQTIYCSIIWDLFNWCKQRLGTQFIIGNFTYNMLF